MFYDFSFSELYGFITTVLGMVLSYLAGRASRKKGKKRRKRKQGNKK